MVITTETTSSHRLVRSLRDHGAVPDDLARHGEAAFLLADVSAHSASTTA